MERPRLQTAGLSPLTEEVTSATSATASPARGKEMRTNLLQKLRPPPLVHAWDFWYEKPPPPTAYGKAPAPPSTTTPPATPDTPQLTHLHSLKNVGDFWSLFNNLDLALVPPRATLSLFHAHILPRWEDPRNARGGAWTFRVPRAAAAAVWREVCLLAISEQLQRAVEDSARVTFRDDICGVAFSPRFGSVLVTVWNRDGGHAEGVGRVLEVVKEGLGELWVGDGKAYYKRHEEHAGFKGPGAKSETEESDGTSVEGSEQTSPRDAPAGATVAMMEQEVAKVRRILDGVKASSDAMDQRIAEGGDGAVQPAVPGVGGS